MTRTIGFYFQNLEKRQTLIKSLTTLKTENSRLKEVIASRSQQVEEMTAQLQAVMAAKKDLHDLLTTLFNRFEKLKATQQEVHSVLQKQREKAIAVSDSLTSLNDMIRTKEKTLRASAGDHL